MRGVKTWAMSLMVVGVAGYAQGALLPLDFIGKAGEGLLPGNEPGSVVSSAIGAEIGDSLTYDTDMNILTFGFEFIGLTGGLRDAAKGIHFHIASPGDDPLNQNGAIALFLNTGTDANVTLSTSPVAIGATSGRVTGTASLTELQEADLLASKFYLNIHSGQFSGGELRGNLVVVPEPTSTALATLVGLGVLARRRA
ncbi:MAG: CHRD domain-containing protein [Phycisphaeraceae bacterium]